MIPEKVNLTGVKATMLATLYVRALESRSADPLLRDPAAEYAVDTLDYDFSRLGMSRTAVVGSVARAHRFDEWTTRFLDTHPQATVLHLACGLDSRAQRVDPPPSVSWFDVDHPEVIDLRHRLFEHRPGYAMIGTSVTEPGWLDTVPTEGPVLVVAEGLTMYLREDTVRALFLAILDRFPQGELIFDVVNWYTVRMGNRSHMMRTTGATLTWGSDDVDEIASWDPRLTLRETVSSCRLPGALSKLSAIMRIMTRIPVIRDGSRLLRLTFGHGR